MKTLLTFLLVVVLSPFAQMVQAQKATFPSIQQLQSPQNPRLGFIIHGGAGVIRKGSLSPEREKEYTDKLKEAVLAGYTALQAGKSSLDAVETAIRVLEDSPLFNAGKGAVFTNDGKNELILYPKQSVFTIVHELGHAYNLRRTAAGRYNLVLLDAEGKRHAIRKGEIDRRQESDLSLMPDGLNTGLSPRDFADLIAYLETLK